VVSDRGFDINRAMQTQRNIDEEKRKRKEVRGVVQEEKGTAGTAVTEKPKQVRKPTLKVGEKDKNGWTLRRREVYKDGLLDVWESPKGKVFNVAVPKTDLSGTELSRHGTLAEANTKFDQVIKAG